MFICPNGCVVEATRPSEPAFTCPTCKAPLKLSLEAELRLELLVLQTQVENPARGYALETVKEAWERLQSECSPELLATMGLTQTQLKELATRAFRSFGIELA